MIDTHALCMDISRRIVFVLRLLNFLGSTTSKTSVANAFFQYVNLAFGPKGDSARRDKDRKE